MIANLAGWIAPAATMIAAIMTAANLGARVTGWGFVLFTVGALAWIADALATGQRNLLYTNAFLLLVDVIGIWRWLGRRARYDAGADAATERSAAAATVPDLVALSSIEGRPVVDEAGRPIASVVDAMIACRSGEIAYLVVSRGGVSGVGETLHALGWGELRIGDGRELAARGLTDATLAARPPLQANRWPASAEQADVA